MNEFLDVVDGCFLFGGDFFCFLGDLTFGGDDEEGEDLVEDLADNDDSFEGF